MKVERGNGVGMSGVPMELKDITAVLAIVLSSISISFSFYQFRRREPDKKIERARNSVEDLLIELNRTEIFSADFKDDNWEKSFEKMDLIRNLSAACVPKIEQIDTDEEVKEAVNYIYDNSRIMRRLYEEYLSFSEKLKFRSKLSILPRDRIAKWPQLSTAQAVLNSMKSEIEPKKRILQSWIKGN